MQDIESVILFLLDQTSKKAKRYTQKAFDTAQMGVTVDQMVLLVLIDGREPLTQDHIAEISQRDKASIARTLDLLEKKGYVERTPDPQSRRQNQVKLTTEGKSFVADHMDIVRYHRRKSLEGFSNEDIAVLKELLMRIQQNMS